MFHSSRAQRGVLRGRSRILAAAAVTAATAVMLVGCSSSPTTPAASAGGCSAPSHLVVGTLGPGVAPGSYLAEALGYYGKVESECNTKITFQTFQTPTTMISGLQNGNIQYAVITAPNIVLAAREGITLTTLANVSWGGTGVFVASNKYASDGSGLTGLAKLPANPTIAINAIGGTDNLFSAALWVAAGQTSKPNFVAVGVNGTGPAVASGKADLAMVTSSAAGQLIADHQAVEMVNASGPVAFKMLGFVPGLGLTATSTFVSKYTKLSELMTSAELQAQNYIRKNVASPSTIYQNMPASFKQSQSESSFDNAWKYTESTYATPTGLISVSSFIALGQLMQKYGNIPSFTASSVSNAANETVLKAAFADAGLPYPSDYIDSTALAKLTP